MIENSTKIHQKKAEPWQVTLVDTGEETMTGGRLKRVSSYLGEDTFCLTYGDGLSNIDISKLISHHKLNRRLATVSAIQPPGRFGALTINSNIVKNFKEKPDGDGLWINGGVFVLEPKVIDYIEDDRTVWEQLPLQNLAEDDQLTAYRHNGFWHAMDTLRDKTYLEDCWSSGGAPWKTW